MKKNQKYNIGLDIGTNSVGWAVTECQNQKIIRKGNKRLWGVRIFDEAQTAEIRRNFRSARRRYDRRRYRINLLQVEFQDDMNKIDPNFFNALKEGFYNADEDKINVKYKNQDIFKNFMIKDYQQQYPTIYHLRDELSRSQNQIDIRLVYLVIHHIIKYRGNFLYKNFNIREIEIDDILQNYIEDYKEQFNIDADIDYEALKESIFMDSKQDAKKLIKSNLASLNNDIDVATQIANALLGYVFDLNKLYNLSSDDKLSLCFSDGKYDEFINENASKIDECLESLDNLKNLYDTILLKKLFNNSKATSLSSLMIEKYNQHKEDLHYLKQLLKDDRDSYNKIFRDKKKVVDDKDLSPYSKYLHNKISLNELMKEVKKYVTIDEENQELMMRINNETFLPKITTVDNGIYPYQLNKDELIKIIENQGKYYPFLLDKTNDGTYKIVKLLEFRIPYYVGPLVSSTKSEFAWMTRKIPNVPITPYNFDEVIDKEKTANDFIIRMVGKCTYLIDEPAMPANSLMYSKYKVLNELKQISINNERIPNHLQHKIYHELFLTTKGTITETKFRNFLMANNEFNFQSDFKIAGYSDNKKFANNMNSYIDFFGDDGFFKNTNYTINDAEQIIEWITIYSDKDILKTKITREYPELSDRIINSITQKNYFGWSSLSRKLLEEIKVYDKITDSNKSIMDYMYETKENFQQIIFNKKYNFQEAIDKYNSTKIDTDKLSYDLVSELATSAKNKRGIYQSLKIVKEIADYIGYAPQNICIEFARENEINKRRTDTRYAYLQKLYKKSKNTIDNYKELSKELGGYKDKEMTDRLYLYFIQEGKCLYSGKPININELNNENLLEVDHIIPRTLIKDNSFDNRALVYREYNQAKRDSFVLPKEYRTQNIGWWNKLKEKGLLTAKKFYSLTRNEYKDEDIQGFINRQIVETRQISKHVANILNNMYQDSNVIYLKASFSHNYRDAFELYKFRDINDFHHAHDAYLAAVLGEYHNQLFNRENKISYQMAKEYNRDAYKKQNFKALKYGYALNQLIQGGSLYNNETGEVILDADYFNKTVGSNLLCNDIMVTRKPEFKTGEFYNQTIYKASNVKANINLKNNLPSGMYGGYSSVNPAYAVMVEYTKKNKQQRKMIGMPIYVIHNKIELDKYITKTLGLDSNDTYRILDTKVSFYAMLNWDGQICYLVGASDKVEVCNGKQFKYDTNSYLQFKQALHKIFINPNDALEDIAYNQDLDKIIKYIVNKMENEYLLYKNLIPQLKEMTIDRLESLTIKQKENIVKELHKLLKCNSVNANFKFLDASYSSAFGKKHGRIIEKTTIINQSITGIYEVENEL